MARGRRKLNTPLHHAVIKSHPNAVEKIIQSGAKVNIGNREGYTALHIAAIRGKHNILKILVRSGEKVNRGDREGNTSLHLAVMHGRSRVVETLVKMGAEVNCENRAKNTPLHVAATHGKSSIIEVLVLHGGRVSCVDRHGNTPLHMAAMHGRLGAISKLCNLGADINSVNKEKNTALHLAVIHNKSKAVDSLCRFEPEMNCGNNEKDTPLHMAAIHGHVGVVRTLKRWGADHDVKNEEGYTPLQMAAIHGMINVMKELIKTGARFQYTDAAINCERHIIKKLMQLGACTCHHNLRSVLHFAIAHCQSNVVEDLIEYGEDVMLFNFKGETPLHMAAKYDNPDAVQTLLLCGADVNFGDNYGNTPLHFAAAYCRPNVIKILIQYGAELNCLNRALNKPFDLLENYLRNHVIESIAEVEADPPQHVKEMTALFPSLTCDFYFFSSELTWAQKLYLWNIKGHQVQESIEILIRYVILESGSDENFSYLYHSHPVTESFGQIINFTKQCTVELDRMKHELLTIGGGCFPENVSLYRFVVATWSCEKHKRLTEFALDKELHISIWQDYPIYCDTIASKFERTAIRKSLTNSTIYAITSGLKEIELNHDTISTLFKYLSDNDILNLVLAYSNLKDDILKNHNFTLLNQVKCLWVKLGRRI